MISYLINRWRFSSSFEPVEDGFLYRFTPRSAAVRVTSDERAAFLRQFTKAYWKYHLSFFAAWLAVMFLIMGLAVLIFEDVSESVTVTIGSGLAIIMFVGILLIDRQLLRQPARALAERIPAASERTSNDVRDKWIGKSSWLNLSLRALFLGGLAWLSFPRANAATWWPIAWVAYFGFCFVLFGRIIWRKIQLARER